MSNTSRTGTDERNTGTSSAAFGASPESRAQSEDASRLASADVARGDTLNVYRLVPTAQPGDPRWDNSPFQGEVLVAARTRAMPGSSRPAANWTSWTSMRHRRTTSRPSTPARSARKSSIPSSRSRVAGPTWNGASSRAISRSRPSSPARSEPPFPPAIAVGRGGPPHSRPPAEAAGRVPGTVIAGFRLAPPAPSVPACACA